MAVFIERRRKLVATRTESTTRVGSTSEIAVRVALDEAQRLGGAHPSLFRKFISPAAQRGTLNI
jgi:hypothetical protein